MCFNQKIEDAVKVLKEGFNKTTEEEDLKVQSIAEDLAGTLSNEIKRLQSQINQDRKDN